ncbi:Polyketide biosynthesis malonyl-ACP decarboxylase PksF [Streptomyces avidinii]
MRHHPGTPRTLRGKPGAPFAAALLGEFSVATWAQRWLADDPDTSQRLRQAAGRCALPAASAACVAVAAARDARLEPADLDTAALIVAGNNLALDYHAQAVEQFLEDPEHVQAAHILRHLDTDAIGACSQALGLHGEGFSIGGASVSSALAVVAGVRLVQAGFVDCCLVVSPAAELSALEVAAFQRSGAMAAPGPGQPAAGLCRPFDRDRQGFVHGQGAAALVLEREIPPRRTHVTAHARILGYGQHLDGNRGTQSNSAGQVTAIQAALRTAGITPGEVDYINAHGTGSRQGDAAEAAALREVFSRQTGPRAGPAVNSTKALIGHCLGAAGLQELIATVLQLQNGFCHPNPYTNHPIDPALAFVGPQAHPRELRTAVSNGLAFGGINVCLVIGRQERNTP